MDVWHKEILNDLSEAIISEFNLLFQKFEAKQDNIYAVALVLDDDALTAYMTVSSLKSLEDKHKDSKWEPSEWVYTLNDGELENGIDSFVSKMLQHYNDEIVPKFQNGFDYTVEREKNLKLYVEGMFEAKKWLVENNNKIKNILFYLTIPGEPEVEMDSALKINGDSKILLELIDYRS